METIMIDKKNCLNQVLKIWVISVFVFATNTGLAAPGALPKTPLFLTDAVEPNIYYELDDSGSMEFEAVFEGEIDGVFAYYSGVAALSAELPRLYMFPTLANGLDGGVFDIDGDDMIFAPYTVLSTDVNPDFWIFKNHIANKLYYNPSVTYSAWQGVDSVGNPLFTDVVDPGNALIDPSNPEFGTFDLTEDHVFISMLAFGGFPFFTTVFPATYFEWIDTNSNGEIDLDDGNNRIEIKPENAPFPSGRSYEEEILNFANWFQYYRKRSYVAKAALGVSIQNSDAYRSGLGVFNGGHQLDVTSMSDPAEKADLLTSLYDLTISCGDGPTGLYPDTCVSTPSRNALDQVGRLFSGSTSDPSPIQSAAEGGECQQNFVMFLSDGFWNGGEPGGIGNADEDDSGTQIDGFDGGAYADDFEVTLADVAMHYYEHDLSPLANNVPTLDGIDEADHQHLVTYTIGFGVNGTLDPVNDDPTSSDDFWPDPMDAEDEERIDDMWHAAYNGRGKYLNAQSPLELAEALSEVAQDIAGRTATAAAVAVNSAKLTSESVVYIAQFNSNKWQGSLFAYLIEDTDLGTLAAEPKWEAGDKLDNRDLDTNPRVMITYDGSNGVPFQWDSATLSPLMVADLKVNPSGGTDSDAIAEARLEYLRGDRSNENAGLQFRSRVSLLGDIVNSGPVFVGAPNLAWPDIAPFPSSVGSRYSDFKNSSVKNRKRIVYSGSNDGMLHAYLDNGDSNDGEEVLAYLPLSLASTEATSGYHYLTNPSYIHNWYVDLTPTVSDVFMTTNAGSGWRSILIGGLRGGGRGLFALDVTDPDNFTEAKADEISMWEFSSNNDSDLGYTYSQPVIALTNESPARWVAIFGNGYNDQGSGEATLFILDIEKGVNGWETGDYVKISTQVGSATDKNGLASPALVDLDGNGTVDRVYAGDLKGNMWVFDLSSSDKGNWNSAYLSGSTPKPLFTTSSNKAITAKPVLASHPTVKLSTSPSNAPNVMVFFGSGQYLVESDKTNTETQSFYGVWDKGSHSVSESDLVEQTFNTSFSSRVLSTNTVDYTSDPSDYGWYFDFPTDGERNVTKAVVRDDVVFFNTFIPETNPCSVGGFGYKFAVDLATGGTPSEPVFDRNDDGVIDDSDKETSGSVSSVVVAESQEGYLPEPVFIEDLSFTGATPVKVKKLIEVPEGRFSWQEIIR